MRTQRLRVRNTNKRRELFVRRRSFAFILFLVVSLVAMLILYTIFDNRRVHVDRVDVSIPTLPRAFNNYTLLAIGDLHDRMFEEGQGAITRALGAAEYDAILFLGDMTSQDTQDPAAFYALIDAVSPAGKPMYYIRGNHDPESWDLSQGACRPSAYLQGALDRGVTLLDRPVELRSGTEGSLWLWPVDRLSTDAHAAMDTARANIERELQRGTPEGDAQAAYNEMLVECYSAQLEAFERVRPEDSHIAATHYPLTPARLSLVDSREGELSPLDMDLTLAGHYHAGQMRIPVLGALVVPAQDLPRSGWFPAQDQVAGLCTTQGVKQYITRGLGASGPKALRFRLFNTPEVALLKLTSRVE